jgi:hypothetical protein
MAEVGLGVAEWREAVVVLGRNVCPGSKQQPDCVCVIGTCSEVERRVAVRISDIGVGAVAEKKLHHVRVAPSAGKVQGSALAVVSAIDWYALVEELAYYHRAR